MSDTKMARKAGRTKLPSIRVIVNASTQPLDSTGESMFGLASPMIGLNSESGQCVHEALSGSSGHAQFSLRIRQKQKTTWSRADEAGASRVWTRRWDPLHAVFQRHGLESLSALR